MRRAKDYGLNHLRPQLLPARGRPFRCRGLKPGIYIQIEIGLGGSIARRLGSGLPVDQWVYAETDRILAAYGDRPSFMLMTHGNEPGGGGTPEGEAKRDEFLGLTFAIIAPRIRAGCGRPARAGRPLAATSITSRPHTPYPRAGRGAEIRINAKPPETLTDYRDFIGQYPVPVISHEIGQWCVYPNLADARQATSRRAISSSPTG
jgi:hypothetical protein